MDKLWDSAKYAKEYPPEWYVVSVVDVIELLEPYFKEAEK